MVIKSKGNNSIVVFALVCIIIFFLILLFEFDNNLIPISSIICSLLLLILIRYWIATGKTIIMSKTGCTVSFLGYKRVYDWEELKTKYIEYYDNSIEYRTPYTGGVVFSKKEIRKPKWLKIATYSNTYYGEHTTSVDGNGANPGDKEILNVGMKAGMKKGECIEIMQQIKCIVNAELSEFVL